MYKTYRLRTNISQDQVVRTTLSQDVDFLEILSLKIKQEDTYKLHVSNYGIIVGRVLANDAFGIPNAKVSVFIPLEETDQLNSDIKTLYPYVDIQTKDKENRRYNLLPDDSNDICYRVVGSFPNKRVVLDNDTEIEIFDKYWKFTSVTNKSGDYMIFGVPKGTHQVHVDVDLSDIGVLSQKPRDFIYKGYNISQFDNSSQFKESTNLDNLSQLLSQNSSVYVYPFWGDKDVEEVAITRCDLQVQYKFEPTCVFFGSVVSDNYSNNIGDKCNPSDHVGFNRNLIAGEGTIEMIRKTQDGLVEEFQIQGNRLIDGNGVWCYQIPMNLDYVGTDEFGNIVPTDNPNKGVPTRTSVRFRFSFQETNNEGVSRHRAKYLVPNNPKIDKTQNGVYILNPNQYLQCYEFGSATSDEYFRDLYWNKVYSVKNYIPRIQLSRSKNSQKYSAIRTVNDSGNLNPFPFNHARFRLYFGYRVICILMQIIINIICGINAFVSKIAGWKLPLIRARIFKWVCKIMPCIGITGGLTESEDNNIEYFPCCYYDKCMNCEESGCKKETKKSRLMDVVQQSLAQEYDTVNLDFYNDWINGCLYFPLWFWKKTKKKKFLFGLFTKKAINRYCNCDSNYSRLRVTENCSLYTDQSYNVTDGDGGNSYHYQFPKNTTYVKHGVIKEMENKDGLKIYYYAPGVPTTTDYRDTTSPNAPYVRLYSTDIILLGSLNDCDLDNLPRPFVNLPSTTANIPYLSTLRDDATDKEFDENGTENDTGVVEVTGMDWLGQINDGLFMDLTCTKVKTKPKTCINLARMCELGVTLDSRYYDVVATKDGLKYDNEKPADGMITRFELVDNETRAMFASLNHNGLTEKTYNPNTGYDTYKLIYNYPLDFDGHLNKFSVSYTSSRKLKTYDNKDDFYINYKFGVVDQDCKRHFYSRSSNNQFPLFNNSFYFYFGLNEGNTAIDKFNNLFYSECFKNYKYPFTLTYTFTPAKWCKTHSNYGENKLLVNDIQNATDLTTDYATISIIIDSIKLPYSYQLLDDNNNLLLSESNIFNTELKFGYQIQDGEYTDTKFGVLQKNNGDVVTIDDQYAYLLDNGTYNLLVTDVNGNSITQPLNITQAQITMNVEVLNLGDKYYSGSTQENDICNEFGYYGEIIIKSINIDGKDYQIIKAVEKRDENNDFIGYDLTCQKDENNISNLLLTIEPSQTAQFNDCICKGNNYKPYINSGALHFNVWIPDDYKITITQYCHGELNDNVATETISVANGSPFLTYLSETPIKFIIGKNTQINNVDFYSLSGATTPPNGWFNVHNEDIYKFEPVSNQNNISVWEDFVETDYYTDDNGIITDISLSTKVNILSYKYTCLMNMALVTYIDDTEEKNISYTSSGGKAPILYRGCYPQYANFSDENTKNTTFNTIIYDSDASISCLAITPNIVSENYTQYNDSKDYWELVLTTKNNFNPLFVDSKYLGNYFAAFTSNASMIYEVDNEGNGKWVKTNTKYESNPYKSNPYVDNVAPGESLIFNDFTSLPFLYKGDSTYNPYFRALTIDRRIDYCYFIMMPYNGENIFSYQNEWNKGRMVGYQINGIEMGYDSNYNIAGVGNWNPITKQYTYDNKLEYYFPLLYTDPEEEISCFDDGEKLAIHYTQDLDNKRLYSCSIRTNQTYNIKNYFWGKWKNKTNITLENNIPLKLHDYSSNISSQKDINGTFSLDNYPTIRRLDIYSIPSANIFSYSAKSCKYEDNLELIDNGGSQYTFNALATEGEETVFSINGNTSVKFVTDNLESCASNGIGNITFKATNINDNTFRFNCSSINMTFSLPLESTNTTHRVFSSLPYICWFNILENNQTVNPFNTIKTIKLDTSKKYTAALSDLVNDAKKEIGGFQLGSNNIINNNDSGFQVVDSLSKNQFNFTTKYLAFSDGNAIIYDDDSFMRNISYKYSRTFSDVHDIIGIYYFKHFMNNESDNLSKDIVTLNIGALIDARPFEMSYELAIDESMSGSGSSTVDIPTTDVDEDGNQVTGSTSTDVETNVTIQRQITTFHITIPDSTTIDESLNQQFKDPEKMSASLKYDKKVISNATISLENNDLSIEFIWGGALSGVLIGEEAKKVELYLKVSNNFIYKLMFTLKKPKS